MKKVLSFLFLLSTSLVFAGTLSLDFHNAKVVDVLDYIRENSDLNLAYSASALLDDEGNATTITIRAENISPELALKAVAQASGGKLEKKESIYVLQSGRVLAEAVFGAMFSDGLATEKNPLEARTDDRVESVREVHILRGDEVEGAEELERSIEKLKAVEKSLKGRKVLMESAAESSGPEN